jgi:hypothetical protein
MDNSEVFHDAFFKLIDFAKEHLNEEQFKQFIYDMCTCGIENVYIEEIPVYENVECNGAVLWKRIKNIEYKVVTKHDILLKGDNSKKCDVKDSLDWLNKNQQWMWNAWNS